jgi:endoglucanase Acf2
MSAQESSKLASMIALGAVAAATAGILLVVSNRNGDAVTKRVKKIMKSSSSKERLAALQSHEPQHFGFRHECVADRTFGTLNEATGF